MPTADDLAARFEGYEPDPPYEPDANAIGLLRAAVAEQSAAERHIVETVRAAHDAGLSWSFIGAYVGTSGEAARRRYASKVAYAEAAGTRRPSGVFRNGPCGRARPWCLDRLVDAVDPFLTDLGRARAGRSAAEAGQAPARALAHSHPPAAHVLGRHNFRRRRCGRGSRGCRR